MLLQLSIGSLIILLSMAVIVAFICVAMSMLKTIERRLNQVVMSTRHFFATMSAAALLVLAANTVCVWIWAGFFKALGVFESFEEALYFSLVSFTTVGYGDVVVREDWRITSGFVAVNGLLAFGVFTAFLMEVVRNLSTRWDGR
ncbi:MAG: potassium channel family protein [Pseudomonadota bacterium]